MVYKSILKLHFNRRVTDFHKCVKKLKKYIYFASFSISMTHIYHFLSRIYPSLHCEFLFRN